MLKYLEVKFHVSNFIFKWFGKKYMYIQIKKYRRLIVGGGHMTIHCPIILYTEIAHNDFIQIPRLIHTPIKNPEFVHQIHEMNIHLPYVNKQKGQNSKKPALLISCRLLQLWTFILTF